MKNVLIMGIGRAGKTTLSHIIKNKYPSYNLIHSDSIKWSMIRGADKEQYYKQNIKEQKEFEHGEYFQKVLLEFLNSCIRNDEEKYGYILESGQLLPKYVREKINFENTIVVCLGHGELTKEKIIELCRKNDTINDWSYTVSDEELESHAEKWDETNRICKKECKEYGIEYIDTSTDRELVLNKISEKISKEIEEDLI